MFDNLDDPTDDIQKFDAGQPLTEKPGKGQKVRGEAQWNQVQLF